MVHSHDFFFASVTRRSVTPLYTTFPQQPIEESGHFPPLMSSRLDEFCVDRSRESI